MTGCSRASSGCDNCYAVKQSFRNEKMGHSRYEGLTVLNLAGDRHFNGVILTHDDVLRKPLGWKRPRLCFVNSMSDLFHKGVPDEFIDRVFAVMAAAKDSRFQILTKRPERMAEYLRDPNRLAAIRAAGEDRELFKSDKHRWRVGCCEWPLPNVWIGTSVEDQQTADERIPHLLRAPARFRFLSCEPLLGPVDILTPGCTCPWPADAWKTRHMSGCPWYRLDGKTGMAPDGIHWVIIGGESGPGARLCDVMAVRSLIAQCQNRQVRIACFVKQLGRYPWIEEPGALPSDIKREPHPDGGAVLMLGHPKGGDPAEWPQALNVQEYPDG